MFTAGSIRNDFKKIGESPKGNKRLMNPCTLSLTPIDGGYLYVCVCEYVHRITAVQKTQSHSSAPFHTADGRSDEWLILWTSFSGEVRGQRSLSLCVCVAQGESRGRTWGGDQIEGCLISEIRGAEMEWEEKWQVWKGWLWVMKTKGQFER